MQKIEVYVLELDGIKALYLSKGDLIDSLNTDLDIEGNENVFKIYSKQFTPEEIDKMPEFDGF